jgi:hypothetical protein
MLGFSSLSESPFADIAGDIMRLESSALLDSLSIINPSAIIKFFSTASAQIESQLISSGNNIFKASSSFNGEAVVFPGTLIKIPDGSIFINESAVSANYLSRINSPVVLDVQSNLVLSSYLSFKSNAIFKAQGEILPFASIKLYPNSKFDIQSILSSNGNIDIVSNSIFSVDSKVAGKVLSRAIGNANLLAESSINLSPFFKTYLSSNIEVLSNFESLLTAKFFESANFEVVAVLSSNISQINRDIVYYVVYTDKVQPFNMFIARVK